MATRANEVSRDGVTGLIFGLTRRFAACPADREEIAVRWRRYRDLIRNDLYLYPGDVHAVVNPAFSAFMEVADKAILGTSGPILTKIVAWELTSTNGADDVVSHHKACYPFICRPFKLTCLAHWQISRLRRSFVASQSRPALF
jgi:hypothetical protein